jgi:hypothetical protein
MSVSTRQIKEACERPPHAQWARPAGQVFGRAAIALLESSYSDEVSLLWF